MGPAASPAQLGRKNVFSAALESPWVSGILLKQSVGQIPRDPLGGEAILVNFPSGIQSPRNETLTLTESPWWPPGVAEEPVPGVVAETGSPTEQRILVVLFLRGRPLVPPIHSPPLHPRVGVCLYRGRPLRCSQSPKSEASFEPAGGVTRAGDTALAEQWVVLTEAGESV